MVCEEKNDDTSHKNESIDCGKNTIPPLMFPEQTPHCSPDKASEETSPGFSNNPKVLEMAVLKQWVNPGGRCDFFFKFTIYPYLK